VFDYAPAASIQGAANVTRVSAGSSIILSKSLPSGFDIFDVIPDLEWMALTPIALGIGDAKTLWPGTVSSPIAMIDTGGGPVFLSDPNAYVYNGSWPNPVPNPDWTSKSDTCESTREKISVTLGDGSASFSYSIDPSLFPPSVQGLTLVMCKANSYMMGQQGMNIGGISALVNRIMIDYKSRRVGLTAK
jgi:hypothetical protein